MAVWRPGAGSKGAIRGATPVEETLDPEDWNALRALGHQMLDDIFDSISTVRDRPVWQPMPEAARQRLRASLPLEPTDAREVYEECKQAILPYPTGNTHPRFWGWVMGTGTPIGMLADMLVSGMNAHGAGYDQAAPVVERQVIEWIAQLLGFPKQTSGLLVSGASVGNLIGLAVARNVKAGFDVRRDGLQGTVNTRLVVYCSTETHSWAQRAVELLGLGNRALYRVPVGEDFRIDLVALRAAIEEDRSQGLRPICIIGNAGTVNTGAFDDLLGLADICRGEGLWFHVDGAFGAWAAISQTSRALVRGLELADSMGVDLHKWPYLPFEAGCALVRDPECHRQTFAVAPAYLTAARRGILAEPMVFADLGLDLSRSFKALKVWMSFKVHGVRTYGRLIEQNIQQARYLAGIVEQSPDMECLVPVSLERFAATPSSVWPCFDTTLLRLEQNGFCMGLIAGTVGAPFAVLVAEQLIACGCRHIIGYSSSGAVADWLRLPCLVVPDRALRDEGTSYHYLSPAAWIEPRGTLAAILALRAAECGLPVHRGPTWTTDAPYRETQAQIERHRADGILTVEMEAAALMALAQVSGAEIASLLHMTNTFATTVNDFDKGPTDINQRILNCCFEAFSDALRAADSTEE